MMWGRGEGVLHIVIFNITTMYSKCVVFVAKCKKVWYINNVPKRYTKKGVYSMLEIVEKFLDSLYEASKLCDEFNIYKFQKEWYENNGYVVLFDNGHHTVFHKAKDN